MKHYVCAYITKRNNTWNAHASVLEAENAKDARKRFDAVYTGDAHPFHIAVRTMARLQFCPLCSSALVRKGNALECSKWQCGLKINLPKGDAAESF